MTSRAQFKAKQALNHSSIGSFGRSVTCPTKNLRRLGIAILSIRWPSSGLSDIILEWFAGARYWITRADEAEIAFMVADDYQKQGVGTAMLNHLCTIARQAGLKHLYALATPDNEGASRLLKKLGFPCDVHSDPAQRMRYITVHLTSAVPT